MGIQLREHQKDIVETAFNTTMGIVRSCTGSGKTLSIAALVGKINKPTIIYVIGLDLLQQFYDTMCQVFPNEHIGFIGNGVCNPSRFTVASIWTVARSCGLKDDITLDDEATTKEIIKAENTQAILKLLQDAKCHILDECQLAATATIKEIYKRIDPERIYGFSATPYRQDGSELLSNALLGDQIIDISASAMIEKGYLAKPFIHFVDVPKVSGLPKEYASVYKAYVVDNEVRNKLIIEETKKLLDKGRQVLVLFKQIRHGSILKDLFDEAKIEVKMLYGNDSLERRSEVKAQFLSGKLRAIISSTIFDTGVDLPQISGLVLAGSGKAQGRSLQRLGRSLRRYEGKETVDVIDFADNATFLKTHSAIRKKIYQSEPGFEIV